MFPTRALGMFPNVDFSAEDANTIGLAYARAIADLIVACGLLCLGGITGRLASFSVIFAMFFMNHVVDGVAYPPVVPVVTVNVFVLLANFYELKKGSDISEVGKWSYAAMQGLFGLLFCSEAPFLAQDPFTFAAEGTDALYVGQKLGFVIGILLLMHAAVTIFEAPTGCLLAMIIVLCGMGKMIVVDNLSLPPAAIMFGVLCTIVCLYDQIVGSSVSSKKSN